MNTVKKCVKDLLSIYAKWQTNQITFTFHHQRAAVSLFPSFHVFVKPTFWKKVENSSVTSPLAALFLRAISSMVSCKNLAISSLTLSSFFNLSS